MMEQPPIPCTVGILTFNSADTLAATLAATAAFGERIVCDGGSTDGTLELAAAHGCRVIRQDPAFQGEGGHLLDFTGAMNQLVDTATEPWFFKVDADELPSAELVDELARVLASGADRAFEVGMRYVVDGRVIEDATTYPITQVRVFPRRPGIRYSSPVHEEVDLGATPVEGLRGVLLLPQPLVRRNVLKWGRYLMIEARQARGRGMRRWWRDDGRVYARRVRYLSWRYTKVLRSGRRPRLPLRYELARVINAVALLVAGSVAAMLPSRDASRGRSAE